MMPFEIETRLKAEQKAAARRDFEATLRWADQQKLFSRTELAQIAAGALSKRRRELVDHVSDANVKLDACIAQSTPNALARLRTVLEERSKVTFERRHGLSPGAVERFKGVVRVDQIPASSSSK